MKKILTLILSLALVLSMIPATAFAAEVSGTVNIENTDYTVHFNQSSFSYNAAGQAPMATLTVSSGMPASSFTYTYGATSGTASSASREFPIEAGSYNMYANDVNIGTFEITQSSIASTTIEAKTSLADAVKTELQENASSENLKKHFEVRYGDRVVDPRNYEFLGTITGNQIQLTANGITGRSFLENTSNKKTFNFVTPIRDFMVEEAPNSTDFMYTGIRQDPELKVYKEGNPLKTGTDYEVTCSDEIDVGKPVKVIVTGIGNYTGQIATTFVIKKFNLGKADVLPTRAGEKIQATQGDTTVDFIVEAGGRKLRKGSDYTIDGLDTKKAGPSTFTIKGTGNYMGEKSVDYTVVAADSKNLADATLTIAAATYNGQSQTPTPTLKIGTTTAVWKTDYTVEYSVQGKNAYSATAAKDAGTYDAKVKLTSIGQGKFSKSTENVKVFPNAFKINQRDIADDSITATYTGKISDPVTVKYGTTTLKQYTDYTTDAYSASKPFYTVTGKGNFTGSRKVYTTTKSIANCTITFSNVKASEVYGKTYTPKVTVYDATARKNLAEKTDYEISYKNAKNQTVTSCKDTGNYSVIVTGKGEYTGSKTLTFTITGTDISKYTVILRETTVTADGTTKTPVITKVAYGSSTLSTSDYTVSYQDSTGKTVTRLIEPGTYKVVVTGKNGYSGSCYATYTILGLTQSITGIKNYYKVYPTTQPFKLDPQAAEKTGFTFTSSDPTVASVDAYGYVTMHKPGRAKITITTKGTVKYNQATTSTEIRVYPNKVTMSRNPWTTGKKGQIKVRWNKRVGATRYEIRYSRQKSFKKGSYKTKKATAAVNSYSTQSTTVSKLRKGYTYYVKVRAVTQVYDDYGQKVNYYGNWSKTKTVKVK